MTEVYVVDSYKKNGEIDKKHYLTHYGYEINSDIADVIAYENEFYIVVDKEAIFGSNTTIGYTLFVEELSID